MSYDRGMNIQDLAAMLRRFPASAVAEASGISTKTIYRIRAGKPHKVRPYVAERLLLACVRLGAHQS